MLQITLMILLKVRDRASGRVIMEKIGKSLIIIVLNILFISRSKIIKKAAAPAQTLGTNPKKDEKITPRNIITKRRVKKTKAMPIRESMEPLTPLTETVSPNQQYEANKESIRTNLKGMME